MAKGITLETALSFTTKQLNKMTESELRKVVSVTRSVARKRYERLVESDIYSPSKEYLQKSAKGETILPTVKGMDKTDLINEYKRQRHFIELKTSTVKGTKKAQKEVQHATEEITGRDLTPEEVTEVWETVGELQDGEMGGAFDYKKAVEETANIIEETPDIAHNDLKEEVQRRLIEIYEREQSARSIYTSDKFNT